MGFIYLLIIIAIVGIVIGVYDSIKNKKKQEQQLALRQHKMKESAIKASSVSVDVKISDNTNKTDYSPKRNDWFMNKYKVTGTNSKTNRKKGNEVIIVGTDENKAIERSGLIDVISVEKIEPFEPSENQIRYGDSLGMEHKCYYSSADYSAILTIIENKLKFEYTPIELAEYAAHHNIYISSYCTFSSFLNILFDKLPNEEKIIFFASCIYQSYKGFVTYIPSEHPNYNDFCKFMEYAKRNDCFMKSIYYYSGTELNPKRTIKKLKAKEICMNYFDL